MTLNVISKNIWLIIYSLVVFLFFSTYFLFYFTSENGRKKYIYLYEQYVDLKIILENKINKNNELEKEVYRVVNLKNVKDADVREKLNMIKNDEVCLIFRD